MARESQVEKIAMASRPDGGTRSAGRRINANTASEAELEGLPGIGPVIARRIVDGRPSKSVDDLRRVRGLVPRRPEVIRRLVSSQ